MSDIEMSISDMTLSLSEEDDSSSSVVYGAGLSDGGYISDECGGRYTVDCWGDGYLYGYECDTNAPEQLGALLGDSFTVNNYAQYGETAEAVAFRQGGIYAAVAPFTVSSGINDATKITYSAPDGDDLSTMSNDGDYNGSNHVFVGDEEFIFRKTYNGSGKLYALSTTQTGKTYSDMSYMRAEGCGVNHAIIICVGGEGWIDDDPATLRDIICSMIRHNGNNNFIVASPPTGNAEDMLALERTLGAAFGRRFFNSREYLSTYGLADNSLTATDDDTADMALGKIPPSLLNDEGYGNKYMHASFAKGIYRLGAFIGLWP